MQTFKQIPYQNYIELVFNQKNLNEVQQQQAMIKYKRNSQLLSELFSFRKHQNQSFKSEHQITEQQLQQFEAQIQNEKQQGQRNIQRIKENAAKYEELFGKIKNIQSKEQIKPIIEELKANDMYDAQHPFFVEGSPFYLNTTDEQYLEVKNCMDEDNLQKINFLELN